MAERRQVRCVISYACMYAIGLSLVLLFENSVIKAAALGFVLPGGGFLALSAFGLFCLVAIAFAIALFLWFATGNVILPIFVWIGSLLFAPLWVWQTNLGILVSQENWQSFTIFVLPILGLAIALTVKTVSVWRGRARREQLNAEIMKAAPVSTRTSPEKDDLSLEDLQHITLLLDRALQPIDQFDGFEWIDQFQTSAVRYQLNFISYALSVVQAEYLPAFKGYLHEAQDNLATKQQNWKIWRYWQLENLWGNFSLSRDPIARDNIMYSGFVAAQLAYRCNSVSYEDKTFSPGLTCTVPSGEEYSYSLTEMIAVLTCQYKAAEFGLLPCEPNWIYPLCNAITGSAIKAHDAFSGDTNWHDIAPEYRSSLDREFLTAGCKFVPFRSAYTGFAAPPVGGAVIQAFPCLFLNTVLPEIAHRQWFAFSHDMKNKTWRRALWPIDVGNYGLSRASSYSATAAAAREMGDHSTADHLLKLLDDDCPATLDRGTVHRRTASLWAHANEVIARVGKEGTFRRLANEPVIRGGAYLKSADYSEVLVAKCKSEQSKLRMVFYPQGSAGLKSIVVAGLEPLKEYTARVDKYYTFYADAFGEASLQIPVCGRTCVDVDRKT